MTTVQDIIDRAGQLTADEADRLIDYYRGMDENSSDRIDSIVNDHWRGDGGKAHRAAVTAAGRSPGKRAMHSVGAEALAVVIRDKLTDDEFSLLTAAWRAVIGPIT